MNAQQYFDTIKHAQQRANELNDRAELLMEHAGDAQAMRYDRPETGRQKGGACNIDAMYDAYVRMERTAAHAYNAAELAATMVAEGTEILEQMFEDPRCDIDATAILWDYYIELKTDVQIANARYMTQSGVCKARQRGLRKSTPYLKRAGVLG